MNRVGMKTSGFAPNAVPNLQGQHADDCSWMEHNVCDCGYVAPYGEHLRCEDHPERPMGHDGCGGAGVLADAPVAENG